MRVPPRIPPKDVKILTYLIKLILIGCTSLFYGRFIDIDPKQLKDTHLVYVVSWVYVAGRNMYMLVDTLGNSLDYC